MKRQRKCQIGDTVGFNNQLLELKLLDMSGKWYSVLRSETVKIVTLLTLFYTNLIKLIPCACLN